MAEEQKRISFMLDQDVERRIWLLKADGRVKNLTTFIRDAIAEKLESMDENPEGNELSDLFNSLNAEGKAWIIKCAQVAASSDMTRSIIRRGQSKED